MNNLKKFKNIEEYKDIIITLPKNVKWEDYSKELEKVKNNNETLNFKVNFLPKKTRIGKKCFLCYKGNIIGWMKIVGLKIKKFKCSTTGKEWKGKFIQRGGEFYKLKNPYPMKGFQGFKYVNKDLKEKLK